MNRIAYVLFLFALPAITFAALAAPGAPGALAPLALLAAEDVRVTAIDSNPAQNTCCGCW